MTYYEVEFWAAGDGKWVTVKELEFISGRPYVRVDCNERLTQDEAETRFTQLSAKHPMFSFRVTKVSNF